MKSEHRRIGRGGGMMGEEGENETMVNITKYVIGAYTSR
jgi:hypothetical protein